MKTDDRSSEKALILLSGGLDSTVSLAMTEKLYHIEKALFFNYGQEALERERSASLKIAEGYGIGYKEVGLPWLADISSSTLIVGSGKQSGKERGGRSVGDNDEEGEIAVPSSRVENRNGIFLNIAAAFALSLGGSVVIAGFNSEEAVDFPDNSREYIEAVNRALRAGEVHDIRVESPTIDMDKSLIVREGLRLGIPWELLWSCYRGGSVMCGKCSSCSRLRTALEAEGAAEKVTFAGE